MAKVTITLESKNGKVKEKIVLDTELSIEQIGSLFAAEFIKQLPEGDEVTIRKVKKK